MHARDDLRRDAPLGEGGDVRRGVRGLPMTPTQRVGCPRTAARTSPSSGRSWSVTTTSVSVVEAGLAAGADRRRALEVALGVEHEAVEADVRREVDELQRDGRGEHRDEPPAVGGRGHLAVRHRAGDVGASRRSRADARCSCWSVMGPVCPAARVRGSGPLLRDVQRHRPRPRGDRDGQRQGEGDDAEVEQVDAVRGGQRQQHRPRHGGAARDDEHGEQGDDGGGQGQGGVDAVRHARGSGAADVGLATRTGDVRRGPGQRARLGT